MGVGLGLGPPRANEEAVQIISNDPISAEQPLIPYIVIEGSNVSLKQKSNQERLTSCYFVSFSFLFRATDACQPRLSKRATSSRRAALNTKG